MMETLEQIKADAVEVFHFDRECRPQDRALAPSPPAPCSWC